MAATATSRNGACPNITRDARIAMIYEGANGVQALDLVGRKAGARRRQARDGVL